MESGYKIVWTDHALDELKATIDYLEQNWSNKEISKLAKEIERTLALISNNPFLFPESTNKNVHRVVILKLNMMYYRIKNDNIIEILSFFSNRQNPKGLKL